MHPPPTAPSNPLVRPRAGARRFRTRPTRLSLEEFERGPLNRSDQPGTFRTRERG
jgi:hypothetical protein